MRANGFRCCRRYKIRVHKNRDFRGAAMTASLRAAGAKCFGDQLVRFAAVVAIASLSGLAGTSAQTPSAPVSGVDAALLEDMVIGSRILSAPITLTSTPSCSRKRSPLAARSII
jgi:hypothetical protein